MASRGHEFSGTFNTTLCIAEPCTGVSLKKPNGVAVNEASGQVYVVDEGANRVVRFDKEGNFVSEFNGSGLLAGEEHAAGSLEEPGEVETGKFLEPQMIAIDNSCVIRKLSEPALAQLKCEEEDPSDGDVYVVDAGNGVIDKYTATGGYVGQITEAAGQKFNVEGLDGVAVDLKGRVWVLQEAPKVSEFTNTTPNAYVSQILMNSLSGFGAPGFAVDSAGNFYVRNTPVGRPSITKVDPTGKILIQALDNAEPSAVSVDQSTDNAILDDLTSVPVFNSEGTLLERLGEEHGEKHLTVGAGIGVNASENALYVADSATAEVVIFGPQSPSAPSIESESFGEVAAQTATLGAQINPRSEANEAATRYSFQYGACASLATCHESGYEASVPIPEGQIAPSFEVQSVSVQLEGLKPNTTYHFKVLAHNAQDPSSPSEGEVRTFTTRSAGGELALPDDRGYELVSPPDKFGSRIEPIAEAGVVQAAASGGGLTYLANAPTEAHPQGSSNEIQVLSRRGVDSWSSRDIAIPHVSATGVAIGPGPEYKFFDPELELSAVQPFGEFNPLLSEEASESTAYLHDLGDSCGSGCFRPLVTGKAGFANVPEGTQFGEAEGCKPKSAGGSEETKVFCGPKFLGATEDLSHVVLSSKAALTEGGPALGLYEWSGGTLVPVSVLTGGAGVPGAGLGLSQSQSARGAISVDGSRVAFSTFTALYLRDTAREETVQLDQAEACGGCESGGGQFQIASTDGSRVFFTDTKRLTSDSGAEPVQKHTDLYECQIVPTPKLSCELSDLTPKPAGEEGALVRGSVLGAGADGSDLYFVANGLLSGANGEGKSPASGQPNLYLRHGAVTSFIATLASGDETDWMELNGTPGLLAAQPTRVSTNGKYLEFMSQGSPTGYDNRDRESGKPTAEVYLFDAESAKLECASCDPSGERPRGIEYLKLEPDSGGLVGGPRGIWPAADLVAANVPGWPQIGIGGEAKSRYQPRYLNDEGRLFFNSVNSLVAQDSNGTQDVYEYEPPDLGSCEHTPEHTSETYSERSGGCVSLISAGTSAQESAFMDASESGNDIFLLTGLRLVPTIDTDNAMDVYDAHVCSAGAPCIVYPATESSQCEGESSCKAPVSPQPQIFGAPPSQTFQGPGNLPPGTTLGEKTKTKSPEEIRAEKLKKALKACRAKRNKKKRQACEKSARKRYAKPKPKSKAKKSKKGKGAKQG